ncbi:MAG: hypothetical protein H6811_02435 [Phycisphaeraceae bacterium]|nr:hypothetical protein [Phycisphaeraceae bacterium]
MQRRPKFSFVARATVIAIGVLGTPGHADPVQVAKLQQPGVAGGDRVGYSVSIQGNLAAVGATNIDDDNNTGAVHLFVRENDEPWMYYKTLEVDPGGDLGCSVHLNGDLLIVGACSDDEVAGDAGAAYIFQRDAGGADNWGQVAKLTAPDGASGDNFGWAVAISGVRAYVGADMDADFGTASGAVYVYEFFDPSWDYLAKMTAPDASFFGSFGFSLGVTDDMLAVGARYAGGSLAGKVYLYSLPTLSIVKQIDSPAQTGDLGEFGHSAAIDGSVLAVGAYVQDGIFNDEGVAYIFERDAGGTDSWGLVKTLHAEAEGEHHQFGWFGKSVDVDGDTVIVGGMLDDANSTGDGPGTVHVFARDEGGTDNWGRSWILTSDDGSAGDFLGSSAAIDGIQVIGGAWRHALPEFEAGAAYVFELETPVEPCEADLTGSSDPNDPEYGVPNGVTDGDDFFYFLDQFAAGNLDVADLTGSGDPNDPEYGVPDGTLDGDDFFFYLDLFVGCA